MMKILDTQEIYWGKFRMWRAVYRHVLCFSEAVSCPESCCNQIFNDKCIIVSSHIEEFDIRQSSHARWVKNSTGKAGEGGGDGCKAVCFEHHVKLMIEIFICLSNYHSLDRTLFWPCPGRSFPQ